MVRIMLMFILFICISFSFLKCMLLFSHSVVSNSFATPWIVTHQAPRSMGFPSQEDWMGCYFLLQGIFPTWGLNPSLLLGREILYHRTTREAKKMHTFAKKKKYFSKSIISSCREKMQQSDLFWNFKNQCFISTNWELSVMC